MCIVASPFVPTGTCLVGIDTVVNGGVPARTFVYCVDASTERSKAKTTTMIVPFVLPTATELKTGKSDELAAPPTRAARSPRADKRELDAKRAAALGEDHFVMVSDADSNLSLAAEFCESARSIAKFASRPPSYYQSRTRGSRELRACSAAGPRPSVPRSSVVGNARVMVAFSLETLEEAIRREGDRFTLADDWKERIEEATAEDMFPSDRPVAYVVHRILETNEEAPTRATFTVTMPRFPAGHELATFLPAGHEFGPGSVHSYDVSCASFDVLTPARKAEADRLYASLGRYEHAPRQVGSCVRYVAWGLRGRAGKVEEWMSPCERRGGEVAPADLTASFGPFEGRGAAERARSATVDPSVQLVRGGLVRERRLNGAIVMEGGWVHGGWPLRGVHLSRSGERKPSPESGAGEPEEAARRTSKMQRELARRDRHRKVAASHIRPARPSGRSRPAVSSFLSSSLFSPPRLPPPPRP